MSVRHRPISDWPHLVGKKWDDLVAREIQDFFARLVASAHGLPFGFSNTKALGLKTGSTGTTGSPNAGWAAADHQHPSMLSGKGDSLTHDGNALVAEPVGPDNTYLMADSSSSTGRRWVTITVPDSTSTNTNSASSQRNFVESYAVRDIITKTYR